jgi:HNH endonuclease
MTNPTRGLTDLSDDELLFEVKRLAARERESTAQLIASLAELDARRLYLGEGYSSLFTYCTQCLHLSEHAAYGRIEAARAARRWPIILELLSDGAVTLTTVCLLASHLTNENHRVVLDAARHKSKRDVEQQVAALRPLAPLPSSVQKVPTRQPFGTSDDGHGRTSSLPQPSALAQASLATEALPRPAAVSTRPPVVAALAPDRYKVQFTVTRETYDKLRETQDLLRHSVPEGDPAVIFDRVLTLLLAELRKRKLGLTNHPRSAGIQTGRTRYIPSSVKREVWERDGGQCAFAGMTSRCAERGFLEFHHVIPFAAGGPTTADNLELRCRAHNAYEAREYFGEPEHP